MAGQLLVRVGSEWVPIGQGPAGKQGDPGPVGPPGPPGDLSQVTPIAISGPVDAIDSTVLEQLLAALESHGLILNQTTP